jgi:polar amino acid transport system permease protein
MDFHILLHYAPSLLSGFGVTVLCWASGAVIGLVLGFIVALLYRLPVRPLRWLLRAYIEIIRGTPFLVQLFLLYSGGPFIGLRLSATTAGILGLGVYAAAYFAEIFRAGIASIDRGQMDAAKAIGMRYIQAMRRIILPQAVRRMIPPFMNEFANLMKLTTLGSVLAVAELLHESENLINNTYRPLEVYTAVAVAFAVIIFPIIYVSQHIERTMKARS